MTEMGKSGGICSCVPEFMGSASRDRVDAPREPRRSRQRGRTRERDSLPRVPACNFRRLAGNPCSGGTPNSTRETHMLPRFGFEDEGRARRRRRVVIPAQIFVIASLLSLFP